MRTSFPLVALTLLAFRMGLSQAAGQNSAFSYQGQLTQNGSAANGLYEMQFTLYDALTNGSVVSVPVNLAPVRVTNGLFTVPLDFGVGAFMGADRWLEITITVFGSDQPAVTLRPRQPITPTPYALHAANAANLMSFANAPLDIKVSGQRALRLEGNGSNAANLIGGHPNNGVAPGVIGAVIAGGGSLDQADGDQPNLVQANFGTVSGGYGNIVTARLGSIGGGRENAVQGAFASVIGGGYRNLIETDAQRSTIGGGTGNRISVGAFYSTISGGEDNIIHSNAPGATINGGTEQEIGCGSGYSFIGGGVENIIAERSLLAAIVGGLENHILSEATGGVIGGGCYNTIGTHAASATISGGEVNQVRSGCATIGGGSGNSIDVDATESIIGGGGDNIIAAGAFKSTLSGGGENEIQENAYYSTIGGGLENLIRPAAIASTIAGGFHNQILSNAANSTIGGGDGNAIELGGSHATIGGGGNNRARGYGATIGGGGGFSLQGNSVGNSSEARWSTIGGGAQNIVSNNADGAFIGGGDRNTIGVGAFNATVGGGSGNRTATPHATIGGGEDHDIATNAPWATISGGSDNCVEAGAHSATVGGGGNNTIRSNAFLATIPGGAGNTAAGPYSFAAGRTAQALHLGSFVWADSLTGLFELPIPFSSAGTNEFSARATGGVRFVSGVDGTGVPSAGVSLAPGSGTWSSLSDRNAKENFSAANAREILEKVAALPLASWNYKAQRGGVRHLGPSAQDFHTAFGLGENDCTITTVDADGVALAAIQGLNQKLEQTVKEQKAEIQALQQSVTELKELVSKLSEQQNGGRDERARSQIEN